MKWQHLEEKDTQIKRKDTHRHYKKESLRLENRACPCFLVVFVFSSFTSIFEHKKRQPPFPSHHRRA